MLFIHSGETRINAQGAVCEVYSPPRVAPVGEKAGFGPGWSLDLTTSDAAGRVWDFDDDACRQRARKLVRETRPLLLIGSPMCTWFSQLMTFNGARVKPEEYRANFQRACRHLAFVFELYEMQVAGGRYFLHEHPAGASSWKQKVVIDFMMKTPNLFTVTSHMCQFGMTAEGKDGIGSVFEPTRWLTNSACIISELDRKCPRTHCHVHLVCGKARAAQVYPPALCRAIVKGFARQLKVDLDCSDRPIPEVPVFQLEILQVDKEDEELGTEDWGEWIASDDVRGGALPARLVHEARVRELEYLRQRQVYEYATWREALNRTGKKPLRLKWIDTNKGSKGDPFIRSRMVCTEVRKKGTDAIFSATPPLESLRALISKAASESLHGHRDPYKLMLIDVSRAHFYAKAVREVYIELPAEDPRSKDGQFCGRLLKTMYGTLDAADRWADLYSKVLFAAGFRRGKASPCHFWHPKLDVWILVHGDDFFCVSRRHGLDHTHKTLAAAFELKKEVIGPEPTDQKELKVLGRIVTYTSSGITCEADPGHLEAVVEALDLSASKPVVSPGAREEGGVTAKELLERRMVYRGPEDVAGRDSRFPEMVDEPLVGEQASLYMSLAARLNYYSLDRPDCQYGVKELMRKLSRPTQEDLIKLKRVARYLVGAPRAVAHYPWQALGKTVTVYCDSDHAGCHATRKSTLGGLVSMGGHYLKSWSRTMSLIALSSGEAELAAVTKAGAEALGVQSLFSDFGHSVNLEVHSDATAAIGICKRNGLGRVRHLAVADLWVQQRVKLGQLRLLKLPGKENPSDVLTKYRSRDECFALLARLGISLVPGRPQSAPARSRYVIGAT